MARPALLETLQRIAEPMARSLGLEIWGIDILQAGRPVVRLYVDLPTSSDEHIKSVGQEDEEQQGQDLSPAQSATVDQCAHLSRMLGLSLEVEDVFASAYVLEVSSPGLSRPFFHLAQMVPFVGDTVEAVLTAPLPEHPGRKKFCGRLVSVQEQTFHLVLEDADETELCVAWDAVRKASRVHVFMDPVKPGKRKDAK